MIGPEADQEIWTSVSRTPVYQKIRNNEAALPDILII